MSAESLAIAHHLKECVKAQAAIVVDGNADEVISRLLAAGWTWHERETEYIGSKRLRYLVPPTEDA